jgi:phosphoserine phosphatase RsbU/P
VKLNQVLKAGGDFYDVIETGEMVTDYLVADASGHDLSASYWTAALKTLFAAHANPVNAPENVLTSMNGTLCKILPDGVFFTIIYARLNRRSGQLTLVNAGHPPAIILYKDKGKESVAVARQSGDVIGPFPNPTFDVTELTLSAGDRFLLYSDGLVEAGGDIEQGIGRLVNACAVRRAEPLKSAVENIAADVLGELEANDDVLLMGVEV